MAKGGGGKLEETEDQKALAEIAYQRWLRYQQAFVPVENRYIESVQGFDSPEKMALAAQAGNTAVQSAFGQGFQDQRSNLAAGGVNPTSGMYQQALADYGSGLLQASADNMNRTQQTMQDAKITGMANVVAMGQGQAGQALQGLGEASSYSGQVASQAAEEQFNNRQAIGYAFGNALGFAAGKGI